MATVLEHWRTVYNFLAGTNADIGLGSWILLLLVAIVLIMVSCIRHAVNDKDKWDA